jgi:hypothetical protein
VSASSLLANCTGSQPRRALFFGENTDGTNQSFENEMMAGKMFLLLPEV